MRYVFGWALAVGLAACGGADDGGEGAAQHSGTAGTQAQSGGQDAATGSVREPTCDEPTECPNGNEPNYNPGQTYGLVGAACAGFTRCGASIGGHTFDPQLCDGMADLLFYYLRPEDKRIACASQDDMVACLHELEFMDCSDMCAAGKAPHCISILDRETLLYNNTIECP